MVTYGQVAAMAGRPGRARQVGWALAALPHGTPVPWHRVVNARGEVSPRSGGGPHALIQRTLLEEEGVELDPRGRIDLARFRWEEDSEEDSEEAGSP